MIKLLQNSIQSIYNNKVVNRYIEICTDNKFKFYPTNYNLNT